MAKRILRRPRAVLDVIDSAEFIGRDDATSALRFVGAVEDILDALARHPELGRRRKLRRSSIKGLRSISVPGFERWLVFYRCVPHAIDVIRVLHGARDLGEHLDGE